MDTERGRETETEIERETLRFFDPHPPFACVMVMARADISNGTCYWAQYSKTRGNFIPCGNVAFGNWPCCTPGDVCLGFEGANACYDADSQYNHVSYVLFFLPGGGLILLSHVRIHFG